MPLVQAFTSQAAFDIRFEWGAAGMATVVQPSEAAIIVDVLSFSTCVDVACSRGARVWPYPFRDASALDFADQHQAILAGSRSDAAAAYSLSPVSLSQIPSGAALVLPSPNGATLSYACTASHVYAACLRNASAVARHANQSSQVINVIAAGEKWPDGTLRPALEDLLGAGAVIHALAGRKSPEAQMAEAAFVAMQSQLAQMVAHCASGVELGERGYEDDVAMACEYNISEAVPKLVDECFMAL
ncbi:2-phosphosulfolactate phosphatase [Variovorax sp. PCZ-1]|uniref:2-phosphosulfolactate phosphatase n=1 Tax=Variovorax sp. PCZ-1 TaxID=2835533 RepID=UPI001BD0DD7C|nr:2-phosphosulfolactate phosphatase [Variovorax sp. PCZ-1]MBS7807618.1 2-phosphosulfolactate phosphatase [Variovorax sp. PCZ-1]